MKLIALDTATEIVSVALRLDNDVKLDVETERNRHSERLLPMVDALLTQAGLSVRDMDAIAFGAGPGAFTGLRTSCGVAQGLAWALDKPVVPVSNLMATASAAQQKGVTGRVLVAIDARMNECFVGVFDLTDGLPIVVSEPELVKPETVAELCLRFQPNAVVGTAVDAFGPALGVPEDMRRDGTVRADAGDIARVAGDLFAAGHFTSAALASPVYVRNRVALTIEERARGERL